MSIIIPANSAAGGAGYQVDNSCRFNSGSSDSLSRSSTAGNKKTWTFSFWLKRSKLDVLQFIAFSDVANYFRMRITSGNVFEIFDSNTNKTWNWYPLLRDTSAFYHLVLRADSTDGTNGNRLRLYINGTLALANTVGSISQNYDFSFNQGGTFQIAKGNSTDYLDGYLAETILIDGQALAPTDFGEFDEDSGIWKPIDVSGLTFGSQGFYLDYKDSGALGNDVSGNNKDFTANNLTAIDQTTDTCTNNFCTFNILDNINASTFAEGNLKITTVSGNYSPNTSTFRVIEGKWYWEIKLVQDTNTGANEVDMIGFSNNSVQATSTNPSSIGINYRGNGKIWNYGGTAEATGYATFSTGDIIMVAADLTGATTGKLYFGVNGTWGNSGNPATGANSYNFTKGTEPWGPSVTCYSSGSSAIFEANFGNAPYAISSGNADGNGYGNFEYAVPSGYLALNSKNLSGVLS